MTTRDDKDALRGQERGLKGLARAGKHTWSQVSGGAGRMVQCASRCCRHSRTISVMASTLRARARQG